MKIKINKRNLTQKQIDNIIEDENTINLTGKQSTNQRIRARRNARIENKIIRLITNPVFLTLTVTIFILLVVIAKDVNASDTEDIYTSHARFINRFPLKKIVIGCYNDRTGEVRQDTRCVEGGDHNIKLPARSDIIIWLKYYTPEQIMNRLALANFESDFNIYAENQYAKGYVQTLKTNNIAIDIDSQLSWLKNREDTTYGKEYFNGKYGLIRGCGYYWNNYNYKDGVTQGEYAVLTCMYRFHYDANNGTWYGIRGVKATKFYKEYLWGIK